MRIAPLLLILSLAACVGPFKRPAPAGDTLAGLPSAAPVVVSKVPATAKTAEQFDTTSTAQRQAAAAAPVPAGGALGDTIASLGDPADPGFWLETPLVTTTQQGHVVSKATGKSAQVELRPIAGPATAGSRISLPALRLLGLSLTDLPDLRVYAG